jgi:hypothetical protein
MSGLHAWLAREGRRQTLRPELLSALVLGQSVAYARYRLGFVVFRLLLRTGLHTLEVVFLSSALPFEYLAPLLTYRALASLATTLHWGATEGLRIRVREAVRQRRPESARKAVETWLGAGCLLATLPVLFFLSRVVPANFGVHARGISLFDAYGLACFVRLLFDVYARTYHAGVFAVRRVYRPLPTLLCADLLEVLVIVVGFESLGAWSIPLAIGCAGAVDAALGVHYARAAYRRHRMPTPRWRHSFTARPTLRMAALKPALVQSLANLSMQLDALLLLLLVQVDPPRSNALSFAVIYYVLRPLLGLATHWVRSFYFDLSRIEAGALHVWRPRLLRFLRQLALACALIGAALTLCVVWLLWPTLAGTALLWLVPFFMARAVFAVGQLEAFARARYRALLLVTAALGLGLGLLAALAGNGVQVLCGASVLLGAGALGLRERGGGSESVARTRARDGAILGLAEWLRELRSSGPICIGVLSVARGSASVGPVMRALVAGCAGLRLARHARSHVLLFVPADAAPSLATLVAASGGTLRRAWLSASCRGVDSIGTARAQRALPSELQDALCPNAHEGGAGALVSEFRRCFPAGTLLDLAAGTGVLDAAQLPRALLGEFVRQVVAASRQRDRELRVRLPVDLAVYAPAGEANLVFVVARATPGFAAFRARVRAACLYASFYVVPRAQTHAERVLGEGPRGDRVVRP